MPYPSAPDNCTDVSPLCPVTGTIYGYYPSLPANAFFCGFFVLISIVQLALGIRYRTWTFMLALLLGTASESVGYIGRIIMHSNPFSSAGFTTQICCLIIAPAFISAGIYLTLKHLVYAFGTEFSRLRPEWYTWIFITCDIFSLVLQGAGGGIASTASNNQTMLDVGSDLMLAGIVFQVVVLFFFGYFLVEYFVRVYSHRLSLTSYAISLSHATRFQLFITGVTVSYVCILTRCIYRIPEMSGGWRNPIMQNENEFIVLDGVMITIAAAALTVFHPGYCFPALSDTMGAKKERS
ncbi:sphingoid long-chain base transporter RSB1 [Lepidopterella palustris CBS 459.81]|uniref:Sphingoid long-chain base transporter RSB1 n=1 Tax=Lepidopterella palustris CBS 459.81 TaxID=1314670 RepID=A0A8E2DWN1_9PEZI|nr:sphingoid long-chain base transporter RSB1 [Lepidopterella palustris CBS 459.81]